MSAAALGGTKGFGLSNDASRSPYRNAVSVPATRASPVSDRLHAASTGGRTATTPGETSRPSPPAAVPSESERAPMARTLALLSPSSGARPKDAIGFDADARPITTEQVDCVGTLFVRLGGRLGAAAALEQL